MAAKKKTSETIVPVMRAKHVEVRRLGTRSSAEFEDELRGLFDKGYKVVGTTKRHDHIAISLAIVEDWTFDDFMADLREQLGEVVGR